ncbi:hypothetical protein AGLY_011688 [Aphis glycines]|uniref:Uncharacterized protein n=1 Tax=Aphis glycines TaxID=307491 RepID=A0A6G0TB29_APHGL|nr:hypothetical protein AGLY_011688 [Aphis glycines]
MNFVISILRKFLKCDTGLTAEHKFAILYLESWKSEIAFVIHITIIHLNLLLLIIYIPPLKIPGHVTNKHNIIYHYNKVTSRSVLIGNTLLSANMQHLEYLTVNKPSMSFLRNVWLTETCLSVKIYVYTLIHNHDIYSQYETLNTLIGKLKNRNCTIEYKNINIFEGSQLENRS